MSIKIVNELVRGAANKAVAAFVVALAGTIGTGLLDGKVDGGELLAAVGTALVAGAATYGFANKNATLPVD